MKVYLIDNFDSFTYNLVHLLREVGIEEVLVRRNDVITVEEALAYDAVMVSPGPGVPKESGRLMPVLEQLVGKRPILGICLGMQAIGELYGGTLVNLDRVYHGVATEISVDDAGGVFRDLPPTLTVGRYHSWVVAREDFPDELEMTAHAEDGQVMALRHRSLPVYGLQFHPESVLTPQGAHMLDNFIHLVSETAIQA